MAHDTHPLRPAVPGLAARLAEVLAATDRFVTWWGAHRAWPANEPAQPIDRPSRAAPPRSC